MIIKYITGQEEMEIFPLIHKLMKTHSVLNRLLMEFIQGGNGNVDSLLISFSLSSDCGKKKEKLTNEMLNVVNLALFFLGGSLLPQILTDENRFSSE